jgi:hypothetical protein
MASSTVRNSGPPGLLFSLREFLQSCLAFPVHLLQGAQNLSCLLRLFCRRNDQADPIGLDFKGRVHVDVKEFEDGFVDDERRAVAMGHKFLHH